jgi:hypothetical protein
MDSVHMNLKNIVKSFGILNDSAIMNSSFRE